MSVPTSLKAGPFTSNVLVKKRYLAIYFAIIWLSFYVVQFEFWLYWQLLFESNIIQFYAFLPVLLFLIYVSLVLVSLGIAKAFLVVINLIHPPREGTFLRVGSDKDYCYWSIRNVVKKWPIYLAHKFPFPFLDNICFKLFGVKTKFGNSLFEGWVDTEFVEFGKNIVVGQGSIIQSAVIVGNILRIQKTTIEDDVRIGTHSIIMPGTHMKKRSVLAAHSTTTVGQTLEEGWVYLGVPAKKFKKNVFFMDGLKRILTKTVEDIEGLREKYEMLYTKRHDKDLSIVEKLQQKKEIQERERERLREGKPKKKAKASINNE